MTIHRTNRTYQVLLPLVVLIVGTAAPVVAQDDPFAGALFPPEVVLRHSSDLGLDPGQFTAIKEEVRKAQSYFLDHQLDLQAEMGNLRKLVEARKVDESAALAQLDRVLALEREIKRTQVGLLVRIKNLLRPEQIEGLAHLPPEKPRSAN